MFASFSSLKRLAARLIVIAGACLASAAASYPGWNVDIDSQRVLNSRTDGIGYSGSFYYQFTDASGNGLYRWPPRPGESNDELIVSLGGSANAMAIKDGFLYLAGSITGAGSISVHGILKVNLGTLEISDAVSSPCPVSPVAITLDHNGTIYVGGYGATGTDQLETNMFLKWTGSSWQTVGVGMHSETHFNSGVEYLETDGTNIYVGGMFAGVHTNSTGWVTNNNIACWNVDSAAWRFFPYPGLKSSDHQGIVRGIAVASTNVFVVGDFTNVVSAQGGIARFTSVDLSVQPFGTSDGYGADVVTLGNDAYIAGSFTAIGGASAEGVAKWSGGTWSALGSGINSSAVALAKNGNSVFVRGAFTSAGGQSVTYGLARWQIGPDGAAAPLQFSSGYITNLADAVCSLLGSPGLVCDIHEFDFGTDSWSTNATVILDASGSGNFRLALDSGLGYFRAEAHEHSYQSTNAFGSIVGTVAPGYWMIGDPFQPLSCSQIFPTPVGGMHTYQQTNGSLATATFSSITHTWLSEQTFAKGEGFLVNVPGSSPVDYQVWGIFATNSFSRSLPTGYSIVASPLYHHLAGGSTTQVDVLSSTNTAGVSSFPVNSSSNPKSNADRNKDGTANTYIDYTLTTGGQWQTNSVNTTVPILLGEGMWLENRYGSSQTWSVPLTIW